LSTEFDITIQLSEKERQWYFSVCNDAAHTSHSTLQDDEEGRMGIQVVMHIYRHVSGGEGRGELRQAMRNIITDPRLKNQRKL